MNGYIYILYDDFQLRPVSIIKVGSPQDLSYFVKLKDAANTSLYTFTIVTGDLWGVLDDQPEVVVTDVATQQTIFIYQLMDLGVCWIRTQDYGLFIPRQDFINSFKSLLLA